MIVNEKIVNLNSREVKLPPMTIFHFKYSLRPFLLVEKDFEDIFVDLTMGAAYSWDQLIDNDLYFYEDETDEDFTGIAIIGELKY